MMKIPGLLLSLCCLIVNGSSGVDPDRVSVSVKEGDSVTLNTGVQTNQQDSITWYYNDNRIARINRDQSKFCTDVQCEDGDERFRDRLKLDHQTGSLTITHITNTHSGEYQLKISNGSSDIEKIFNVSVHGVSATELDQMKRTEGESVILDPGVVTTPNDVIMWYFNEIPIVEITGDQSKICTDVQCEERFRDRLELYHQTGSLTITHTTTEDSGEYKLQISNSRFSILKTFRVTDTDVPDSGLSSAAIRGICAAAAAAAVILIVAVAAGIYCLYRSNKEGNKTTNNNNNHQGNGFLPMSGNNNQSQPVANVTTPLLQSEDPQTAANSPQTSPAETEGDGLDQTSDENSTSQDATNVRCEALLHREDSQTDAANSPQTSPAETESEDPQTDANSPHMSPAKTEENDIAETAL